MKTETQIVKGILEGCILKIISTEEIYGYKTVEKLNKIGFNVNEATVYPILARLQHKGFLNAEKRPSPLGPARKYYSLTQTGEDGLKDFQAIWQRISTSVNRIMEDGTNDEKK